MADDYDCNRAAEQEHDYYTNIAPLEAQIAQAKTLILGAMVFLRGEPYSSHHEESWRKDAQKWLDRTNT